MSVYNEDPNFQRLADISAGLERETAQAGMVEWLGSPFGWMIPLPSATRGAIGKRLVERWCASRGFRVTAARGRGADRRIDGHSVAIKSSRLWESGEYRFQQIRDQEYDYLFCLGLSPHVVHAWLLPKSVLYDHVIGHTGQHTGAEGQDTAWIAVDPLSPPDWMVDHGGQLGDVERLLNDLRGDR